MRANEPGTDKAPASVLKPTALGQSAHGQGDQAEAMQAGAIERVYSHVTTLGGCTTVLGRA